MKYLAILTALFISTAHAQTAVELENTAQRIPGFVYCVDDDAIGENLWGSLQVSEDEFESIYKAYVKAGQCNGGFGWVFIQKIINSGVVTVDNLRLNGFHAKAVSSPQDKRVWQIFFFTELSGKGV